MSKLKFSNADLIAEWIEQKLQEGMTDDQIIKFSFIYSDDIYTLSKTRKSGQFDLKCQFGGVINLDELMNKKEQEGESIE